VIGAVVSGSASIVAANTSDGVDVVTGEATSHNDQAAFVGLVSSGSTDVGTSDIDDVDFAVNAQEGDNRLSSSQSSNAATGDGVAGQVIGAVSAGATSIDATNSSTDDSVDTGDADASNDLSAFVGLDVSGDTSVGGADVTGVGFAENLQDGDNNASRNQSASASSGDAISGQVVGGVVSAGGSASVVVANTSQGIDSTSGESEFSNDENLFVGLASNLSSITI
jgi:hypothetical protein